MNRIKVVIAFILILAASSAFADGSALSACNTHGPHITYFGILLNYSEDFQTMSCEADAKTWFIGETKTICGGGFCSEVKASGVELHRLRVIDNHPTEDITCFLYGRLRNGTQVASSQVSSNGVGDQNIANGLTLSPGSSTDARVTLQCNIPGFAPDGSASGIHGLHMDSIPNL